MVKPEGATSVSSHFDIRIRQMRWQDKYTHGIWGAVFGAAATLAIGFTWGGWSTAGSVKSQVEKALQNAAIPGCVAAVMADPTAAGELKTKRPFDYDDVVRDYRKRTSATPDYGFQFNRDCGKAIEAAIAKQKT